MNLVNLQRLDVYLETVHLLLDVVLQQDTVVHTVQQGFSHLGLVFLPKLHIASQFGHIPECLDSHDVILSDSK